MRRLPAYFDNPALYTEKRKLMFYLYKIKARGGNGRSSTPNYPSFQGAEFQYLCWLSWFFCQRDIITSLRDSNLLEKGKNIHPLAQTFQYQKTKCTTKDEDNIHFYNNKKTSYTPVALFLSSRRAHTHKILNLCKLMALHCHDHKGQIFNQWNFNACYQ